MTSRLQKILHKDLSKLISTTISQGKWHEFTIIDDHTMFTCIKFLAQKYSPTEFNIFTIWIQQKIRYLISTIHSDNRGEFKNKKVEFL